MRCARTSSECSLEMHDNPTEETRRRLLEAIEALPNDVQLLRHLLEVVRFVAAPPSVRPRHRLHFEGLSRGCVWVLQLSTWGMWLL